MRFYSGLGIAAILLWSTTVAFSRALTESLGALTTAAAVYLVAGVISCLYSWRRPGSFPALLALPRGYLLGCGGLFVLYIAVFYIAIGTAQSRSQVITVGLINYLWPALSLLFSLPLLHKQAKPWLPPGMALALAGIWLAVTATQRISLQALLSDNNGWAPYVLALVAAVSWALYSNLSRRWAGEADTGAVPLFLLISGVVLLVARLFVHESSAWSPNVLLLLLYVALGPAMLAYTLWDISVRKGDIVLVASLSYFTPLLSSLISAIVLAVAPTPVWWLALLLVVLGAVVCKAAIADSPIG
jgi:drug/metabolite transporter (DMT)-like permease